MIVRKNTIYTIEIDGKEVSLTEEQARSLFNTLKLEFEDELITADETMEEWIKIAEENRKREAENPWPWPVSPWKEGPPPYGWPPTITFKS